MNKKEFIEKLEEQTGYENEKCVVINSVLEENFIFGKKNKDRIANQLKDKLEVTMEEAEKIYNIAMDIIGSGIKNSLKHPFGKR